MEVYITPDIRVKRDDFNYILEFRTVMKKGKNAGEEKWVVGGYFHNMALLCEDLLDTLPMSSSKLRDDLSSVILAVNEARDMILKALK